MSLFGVSSKTGAALEALLSSLSERFRSPTREVPRLLRAISEKAELSFLVAIVVDENGVRVVGSDDEGSERVTRILNQRAPNLFLSPVDRTVLYQSASLELPFFTSRLRVSPINTSFFRAFEKIGVQAIAVTESKGVENSITLLLAGYFGRSHYWTEEERAYLNELTSRLHRILNDLPFPHAGPKGAIAVEDANRLSSFNTEELREATARRSQRSVPPVASRENERAWSEVSEEETHSELLTEISSVLAEQSGEEEARRVEESEDFTSTEPPSSVVAEPSSEAPQRPREAEFHKLLRHGQLILLKSDADFRITEVVGSSERLFGYTREELLGREDMWARFFDPLDLRRLNLRLRRMGGAPHEFGEEIRFKRRGETKHRWLLLKAAPVVDDSGICIGWEGFGVDITDRRLVELQLRAQRQRTEALYEVSRSLRVNLDPALVTLKGLNALVRATGSDAGLCCFYDESTESLEMVAAEGLSQAYLDGLSNIVQGKNLIRYTVEGKKGMLLENIQEDPRAAQDLAKLEDLKATVLMPLMSGGDVLGALVIFSRQANRYGREDFQLVAAAASQISFAARQAEYYTAEKAEADSLAVLYRLSHEISRLFRPSEIGEHVFSIVQQEFASKRLWFGILNNQGTHIVGHAGYGPGIRQQVKEIQVELGIRHDFLDEAIRTKRPVIVSAGTEMECSGLNRIFRKLDIGTFLILPLVSLGQVVGVIVAEPVIGSKDFIQKKLSLLMRMANEVAVVLMARRFEERVAESDKMRVATMLASGVAHNFNNLLQALMGQASLIQMQAQEDSPIQELARTIIDSAGKGASLVKHLLSFSSPSSALRDRFSLSRLMTESRDLYGSLLGGAIEIKVNIFDEALEMLGDSQLIQQAITNLVINAKEAIGEKNGGLVEISARKVRLSSGEIDPSLSPGTYARIDIKDNGEGMDEERLARCFEPFYSSKNLDQSTGLSLSGAGLGLSSAYSVAQQHGGVLTASSVKGEGTTFTVFLPVLHESGVERVRELTAVPRKNRRTALLIQPHGAAGFSIQRMFESFGLKSRLVHDLDKAKVILESPQQVVQLAVVDADYLGKATLSFIEGLRERSGRISVVVLTVSTEQWSGALNGVSDCIVVEKPLSMRALQKVVREFFEEEASNGRTQNSKAQLSRKIERVHIGARSSHGTGASHGKGSSHEKRSQEATRLVESSSDDGSKSEGENGAPSMKATRALNTRS